MNKLKRHTFKIELRHESVKLIEYVLFFFLALKACGNMILFLAGLLPASYTCLVWHQPNINMVMFKSISTDNIISVLIVWNRDTSDSFKCLHGVYR